MRKYLTAAPGELYGRLNEAAREIGRARNMPRADGWAVLPTQRHGMVDRAMPFPHIWLGTSVEDQATADARIQVLLDTPAAVRFVSAEPLLAETNLRRFFCHSIHCDAAPHRHEPMRWVGQDAGPGRVCTCPRLHMVIAGGESGPGARPCDVAWIASVVDQCRAAGCAAFVKQLGARPMMRADSVEGRRAGDHPEHEWPEGTRFSTAPGHMGTEWQGRLALLRDPKGGEMSEWPESLRVRQMPA